jgi:hypothetical protein
MMNLCSTFVPSRESFFFFIIMTLADRVAGISISRTTAQQKIELDETVDLTHNITLKGASKNHTTAITKRNQRLFLTLTKLDNNL